MVENTKSSILIAGENGTLIQTEVSFVVSVPIYPQHLFAEMAAFSQISQKKRGRHEYLNSGLDSREAKRSNSGMLRHDCNLMAVLGH